MVCPGTGAGSMRCSTEGGAADDVGKTVTSWQKATRADLKLLAMSLEPKRLAT